MLKDDRLVGALVIYRKEVRPFNEKQIAPRGVRIADRSYTCASLTTGSTSPSAEDETAGCASVGA
jgi:hypothetical protein